MKTIEERIKKIEEKVIALMISALILAISLVIFALVFTQFEYGKYKAISIVDDRGETRAMLAAPGPTGEATFSVFDSTGKFRAKIAVLEGKNGPFLVLIGAQDQTIFTAP